MSTDNSGISDEATFEVETASSPPTLECPLCMTEMQVADDGLAAKCGHCGAGYQLQQHILGSLPTVTGVDVGGDSYKPIDGIYHDPFLTPGWSSVPAAEPPASDPDVFTLNRSELIPGGMGALIGYSDEFPDRQFLVIPKPAADRLRDSWEVNYGFHPAALCGEDCSGCVAEDDDS